MTAMEGRAVKSQHLCHGQDVMIRTAFALGLARSLHLAVLRALHLDRFPSEFIVTSLAARSLGLLNIQRHLQESHFETTGAVQLSGDAGVSDAVSVRRVVRSVTDAVAGALVCGKSSKA